MFDTESIARDIVTQVISHVDRLGRRLLWAGFPPENQLSLYSALESGPALEEIRLLCRVANGEIERAADTVGEVAELIQNIAELLFSVPGSNTYTIPDHFWTTPLGRAMRHAQLWVAGDDLISHSEAAQMLYGASGERELMRIKRLLERGELVAYEDPTEPNPRHAQRVSQQAVEALSVDSDDE